MMVIAAALQVFRLAIKGAIDAVFETEPIRESSLCDDLVAQMVAVAPDLGDQLVQLPVNARVDEVLLLPLAEHLVGADLVEQQLVGLAQ